MKSGISEDLTIQNSRTVHLLACMILLVFFFYLIFPSISRADDRRTLPGLPPYVIFENMLRYAEHGDTEKVIRSMNLLSPVLDEHKSVFGENEVNALLEKITKAPAPHVTLRCVQLFIAQDVIVLLRGVNVSDVSHAASRVKTALLEWHLIESAALKFNFPTAQNISATFRDVMASVDTHDLQDFPLKAQPVEKSLRTLFQK